MHGSNVEMSPMSVRIYYALSSLTSLQYGALVLAVHCREPSKKEPPSVQPHQNLVGSGPGRLPSAGPLKVTGRYLLRRSRLADLTTSQPDLLTADRLAASLQTNTEKQNSLKICRSVIDNTRAAAR